MEQDSGGFDDGYSKEWAEIAESENKYQKELQEKKDKCKEELRSLMNVDVVWKFLEDNEQWAPEGSVNMEIVETKENGRHVAIDLSEKGRRFERQDEYIDEVGVDHIYVWQTSGFSGDDFSGFMLFPLSNGRYFRVSYSC